MSQHIVVVGATGTQGRGIVQSLLPQWPIQALTRDPNSPSAQSLLSDFQTPDNRLSLVTGHVYDKASLVKAFKGAHGVFVMTSERYPWKVLTEESEMKHELEAGRNLIEAARECGVEHFVFSSLPDVVEASGGRFVNVHHMNNKHEIEVLARGELDCFTGLIPGFFYNNLQWPQYSRLQADGVVRFCYPAPPDQVLQWTDPSHDMGAFCSKLFELGVDKTRNKRYLVLGPKITGQQMAETFHHVTGKPAIFSPVSFEEFGKLSSSLVGPAFERDAIEMMQWAAEAPSDKVCYGALDGEDEEPTTELGLTGSSFEDWLRRTGWTGPDKIYS